MVTVMKCTVEGNWNSQHAQNGCWYFVNTQHFILIFKKVSQLRTTFLVRDFLLCGRPIGGLWLLSALGCCLIDIYFLFPFSILHCIFRMRVKKLPQILALHLKRFKYMEQMNRFTKLSYRVVFPLELRLFNTVSIIVVNHSSPLKQMKFTNPKNI